MRNPEASPEELGYVPHLRSRLIAILVTALGIACLIIGLSTYVTLQNSLYQQAQSDLKETSHRVVQPTSRDGKREEVDCSDQQKSSSLFAPGQASGTIITCVESEGAVEIASKLAKDGTVQTLSANDQVTLGTMALNATRKKSERSSWNPACTSSKSPRRLIAAPTLRWLVFRSPTYSRPSPSS